MFYLKMNPGYYDFSYFLRDDIPKQKAIVKTIVYIKVWIEKIGWLSMKLIIIAVIT